MKKFLTAIAKFINRLLEWLKYLIAGLQGPSITAIDPITEYAGSIIDITGNNFGSLREQNIVTIGGVTARVIEASPTKLKVLSSVKTLTGKIRVKTGSHEAVSPYDFNVKSYPAPGSNEDGPPIVVDGTGFPSAGDVPPTGTLNVMVVLVNPTDRVPANPATSRQTVIDRWNNVHTFYDQASYNTLNVHPDFTASWHTLFGNFNDYIDTGIQNIRPGMLPRLMAECAQHAQNDGFNLNNYQMIACVIFLNGTFIRAWGGSSTSSFTFVDAALGANINITTTNPLNELWIQESANWGRFAHETGHNIVAVPSGLSANTGFGSNTLGEDIYGSDLVDASIASAQNFDMMGRHDDHPIFSAYHMERTGWYSSTNILNLVWNGTPFSNQYELVAHGLTQNTNAGRYHVIKIRVGDGLFYYVEVRQRPPGGSTQQFDENIPLGAATHSGGVIVTKVFTDLVNNNQQMRFITLLHTVNVLAINQVAIDPARNLKITVLNDNVATNPLVCQVRVEWAQAIADDPAGQFDIRLDPWDSNWQSPDIWVDRNPFGSFDNTNDAQGRPQGNGDRPRPHEINHFHARVHNDGVVAVNNVLVTFYAVNPPGVGDNGNWAPLSSVNIATINNNSHSDIFTNWVPVVGEHTCLKVYAQQQLGEVTGGNNAVQENVFDFEAPASSVPMPVYIPVAVRNPLRKNTIIQLSLTGVKIGYIAQFPNTWLYLGPLEERRLTLTVIPVLDYPLYKQFEKRYDRKDDYVARVNIQGYIPREYEEELGDTGYPASKLLKIGGVLSNVKPKKKVEIEIWQDREQHGKLTAVINGRISYPVAGQRIRVEFKSPLIDPKFVFTETDANGNFIAGFQLNNTFIELQNAGKINDEKDFIAKIKLTARASIINASEVAETDSAIILVVL